MVTIMNTWLRLWNSHRSVIGFTSETYSCLVSKSNLLLSQTLSHVLNHLQHLNFTVFKARFLIFSRRHMVKHLKILKWCVFIDVSESNVPASRPVNIHPGVNWRLKSVGGDFVLTRNVKFGPHLFYVKHEKKSLVAIPYLDSREHY